MKIRRILSFLAALALGISMCGCGGKKSSSETDSSTEESFELPEDMQYYETPDAAFIFGTSNNLTETERPAENESLVGTCDIVFNAGDEDTLIGILGITGLHQTAAGMGSGLITDFEETGLYTNVKGEELTINENPAYRMTADAGNGILFTLTTVQFGNGDILAAISTSSEEHRANCEKEMDIILHSLEYSGDPLNTEPQTYENDYFSIAIEPKWYFRKATDDFTSISLNLQDDISDMMYAFSFSALTDEDNAEAAAKATKKKFADKEEILHDTADYMGFKAQHVHYLNPLDAYVDYYIFENDGTIYQAIEICPTSKTSEYKSDIQPVLDNIKLK